MLRKCVLWNDWGKCLEIGAETRAEKITDIRFEDCDIIHLCGPALDILNVDWAEVCNVRFENTRIENENGQEAHFTQRTDAEEYPVDLEKIWDPLVVNLRITKHLVHDVAFEKIFLNGKELSDIKAFDFNADEFVHTVSFNGKTVK